MFGRGKTKQEKKLGRQIKKYVKKGYRVESRGKEWVSLYKPSMSFFGSMQRAGIGMATFGMSGKNMQPDRHKTVYIYVDEGGKAEVSKGTARV